MQNIVRHIQWKQRVDDQYDDPEIRDRNSEKWVLSLFDSTGNWSRPWAEAGYNVLTFDIQKGQDIMDFSAEYLMSVIDEQGIDASQVYFIMAACPCTDFASSGARWFSDKDADGRTEASKELVFQTLKAIEFFRPMGGWALENPVGRIERLTNLPKARYVFQPHHFGENYTKKTLLWGQFQTDLPTANTEPTEGSKMHQKYGGSSVATKNARSETPEGFAYAFFCANNYEDLEPEVRMTMRYKPIAGAVATAMHSGLDERSIQILVDHHCGNEDFEEALFALGVAVHAANTLPETRLWSHEQVNKLILDYETGDLEDLLVELADLSEAELDQLERRIKEVDFAADHLALE